jgi:hypothetical protein
MSKIPDDLPSGAGHVARRFGRPIRRWARCAHKLDLSIEKRSRLVKLALAIGASSEGAVHSHVRRDLEEGRTLRTNSQNGPSARSHCC